MGEILISQEYIQVEYLTRYPYISISNEFIQVEYIPGPSGLGNLNAEINGSYIIQPEYTYIKSTHDFEDFDVQVDFTICSGVDTTKCGVSIDFEIDSDNRFFIRAGSYLSNDVFMCEFRENGVWNFYTTTRTNQYGKLRISRILGNLYVYYKDGSASDWTEWMSYSRFSSDKGNILLTFYSAGSFNSAVTLDNFAVNYERACSTCYFADTFYGIDGELYNQSLWTGSTSNIEIEDDKLHMLYSNVYTHVSTKYEPVGDFNVQVDFSIGTYQQYCCWSQALVIYFDNGDRFDIRYRLTSDTPSKGYITSICIDGVYTTLVFYPDSNMSGKFRITKIGNIFSSYFFIGDKWFSLYDWHLEEETEVNYIRLERSSWSSVPSVECYFDNFIINDDFYFYNDVRIDGDYSHVDGNYIELAGGNIHTNKIIRSANAVTFEWSVVINRYSSNYSFSFVVCNTSFRDSYNDHAGESICIDYMAGVFNLYIDGNAYNYVYGGNNNNLFYPEYGKSYIIGIKFIPGTGTIIYWQGPTNGYLVLDYIINEDLYAWCGNTYGMGTYGTQVTTVHKFVCFEDNILYKDLMGSWSQSVGADETFISSEGRGPNLERWEVWGNPITHDNSLMLVSDTEDKIRSIVFFCSPFEITFEYHDLSFEYSEGLSLSLNLECYDIYKNDLIGVSKFKVGYNGGVASWVNYYCDESSGDSSVYHLSNVSSKILKIINDGYNIQYLLSDGDSWIEILSINCSINYYYKISIDEVGSGVIAYLDDITFSCAEFITPTDAISLVPTSWKFSPSDKSYQCITYVPIGELAGRSRAFSIDSVIKIDSSMFLSYIEIDKDLVIFGGAIVVGDNYSTITSAIDAAVNGEIIYVLPGNYNIGGYTINKDIIVVGVGNYSSVNIVINGNYVNLDGCCVVFKNITIVEQMAYDGLSFRTIGDEQSYFTMDNCRYSTTYSNHVYMFKVDGTQEFYVYLRRCYISGLYSERFAYIVEDTADIIIDIFNCRINLSRDNLLDTTRGYQIRSEIYSNTSVYDPDVTDNVPVLVLFSPPEKTNLYLSTPKGMEKTIACKSNVFNYIVFGNGPGGIVFYGGDNDYYFSEYLIPPVDDSFKLFIQGYVDVIRVFDTYPTYYGSVGNISTVDDLGITLKLASNNTVVSCKIYEPLNKYNFALVIGRNTPSIVDEFIWSKSSTSSSSLLDYYSSYLGKLGYRNCTVKVDNVNYKFFIDLGSVIGIGSVAQTIASNFSDVVYYSDDVDDPCLLSNTCSLDDARWYSLFSSITYNVSDLTSGVFSMFPPIDGCDSSKWKYTGESGYIDEVPNSVISSSSNLNNIYNVKWERNKTDINDYTVFSFSEYLTINFKLYGGGVCDKVIIKSGYNIGTEYAGYISKCSIIIDSVSVFNIEDNINSTITATFDSISFTNIEIMVEEVKQVSGFSFDDSFLFGNILFVNYVKILSSSTSRSFDSTLCNVYEMYESSKLDDIDTSKTGSCILNYYFDDSYVDDCIVLSSLDLNNLPSSDIKSILVKSNTLGDCSFDINEYTVDILSEFISGSIESWSVYSGDAELYEEFFYILGSSTSIGIRFFKNTIFEVGTYYEDIGIYSDWSITDELVLRIYSYNDISDLYICIGDKEHGRYYKFSFSLTSGWNNFRLNFYGDHVTKYVSDVITRGLFFKDLAIFNIWFGGTYLHDYGFLILDDIFIDRSSIKNVLSSKEDGFYIPVYYESSSGAVQLDYTTYWDSNGKIFGDMLSDKTLLSVFSDELSFSLVNKLSGEFVLGVYSYKHNVRSVKTFGKARKFEINDKIKLKLDWYCNKGYFSSDLYINGIIVGRVQFNLIEIDKLKVTGIVVGGSSVYITSIYNSLSLCGQINYIKIYSNKIESTLVNDRLLIKTDGEYKNLVENSPMYIGEIQPAEYVKLPVRYEGKSKELNQLNLKIKWMRNY